MGSQPGNSAAGQLFGAAAVVFVVSAVATTGFVAGDVMGLDVQPGRPCTHEQPTTNFPARRRLQSSGSASRRRTQSSGSTSRRRTPPPPTPTAASRRRSAGTAATSGAAAGCVPMTLRLPPTVVPLGSHHALPADIHTASPSEPRRRPREAAGTAMHPTELSISTPTSAYGTVRRPLSRQRRLQLSVALTGAWRA